jgi:hypothetical protein
MASIQPVSTAPRTLPAPSAPSATSTERPSANREGASLTVGKTTETTDKDGRITLRTGDGDDKVAVAAERGGYSVRVNGDEFRYTAEQMKKLTVETQGGADQISIDTGGKDLSSASGGFRVIAGKGDDQVGLEGHGVAIESGEGNNSVFARGSGNALHGHEWGGKDRFVVEGDKNLIITGAQAGRTSGGTQLAVAGQGNSIYDGGERQRGAATADPSLMAQLRAGLDQARLGAAWRPAGNAMNTSPDATSAPATSAAPSASRTNTTKFSPLPPPSVTDERVFSPEFYGQKYPDLAAHGLTTPEQLSQHWKEFGIKEGRQGSPEFNSVQYLDGYPDLRKNGVQTPEQALQHYLTHGVAEGRLGALPASAAPTASLPSAAATPSAQPALAAPSAPQGGGQPAAVPAAQPAPSPQGVRQVDELLDTAQFAGGLSPAARGIVHKLFSSNQPVAALDTSRLDAGEQEYLARALNNRGDLRFGPDLGAKGWSVQGLRDSFVALEHPDVKYSTFPGVTVAKETASYSTADAMGAISRMNHGVAAQSRAEQREAAVSQSIVGLDPRNAITADVYTGYLRGKGISDADIQQTFMPVYQAQLDRYATNVRTYYAGQGLPPPERAYTEVYAQDLLRDPTILARWPA